MKPCSNPACTHQVEDDARFCGMCGAYVGPEMITNATLTDAVTHRIQQCRDLINSLQSESDEKGKAQKIRAVMNILTSITTDQLPGKPIAHAAEQIQVLSTVVQEMIALPSISPTASAADMQHWPISSLEMRQWTELLIAFTGSNQFSSFDKATQGAVRDALGRFISFIGTHARRNPDTELFLLDLYESITALSVPQLQTCFTGTQKINLLRRLEQRMQRSLASTSPSVSPDQIRLFGILVVDGLSELRMSPTELESSTNAALSTLAQLARIGETQPPILAPTAEAYAALLQMHNQSVFSQIPGSLIRLGAVDQLNRIVEILDVSNQQVSPEWLSVLGENLPAMFSNNSMPPQVRVEAGRKYMRSLGSLALKEIDPDKRDQIISALTNFSRNLSLLQNLDPTKTISGEFADLYYVRLAK